MLMLLSDHFYLGYVSMGDLLTWIETNQLANKNFSTEKTRWETEISKEPNFFSDTELLFLDHDLLILKVLDDQQATFLAQTYRLEQQATCQKLFGESKHIIVVSQRQWNQYFKSRGEASQNQIGTKEAIVLLKDEASIKKSFANWLAKKKI